MTMTLSKAGRRYWHLGGATPELDHQGHALVVCACGARQDPAVDMAVGDWTNLIAWVKRHATLRHHGVTAEDLEEMGWLLSPRDLFVDELTDDTALVTWSPIPMRASLFEVEQSANGTTGWSPVPGRSPRSLSSPGVILALARGESIFIRVAAVIRGVHTHWTAPFEVENTSVG